MICDEIRSVGHLWTQQTHKMKFKAPVQAWINKNIFLRGKFRTGIYLLFSNEGDKWNKWKYLHNFYTNILWEITRGTFVNFFLYFIKLMQLSTNQFLDLYNLKCKNTTHFVWNGHCFYAHLELPIEETEKSL